MGGVLESWSLCDRQGTVDLGPSRITQERGTIDVGQQVFGCQARIHTGNGTYIFLYK